MAEIILNENNANKLFNFYSKYSPIGIIGNPPQELYLGDGAFKICRFCKKNERETTFNKKAHIIPQFMGNDNLLSHFECDRCNSLFSKYEGSFANYLGITRAVSQIQGKKKKLKYQDGKEKLTLISTDKGLVLSSYLDSGLVEINEQAKSLTIKTKRPGYIPIHIPKLLIKIAFGLLTDDQLENFEQTRKFILDTKNESRYKGLDILKILGYFVPGPTKFRSPYIHLYRAKNQSPERDIPAYLFIVHYWNYQLQMIFPFGQEDNHLLKKKIEIPIAPLLVDDAHLEQFGREVFFTWNHTSSEKVSGEEHNLHFSFDSIVKA